jgi:hypothetical protein
MQKLIFLPNRWYYNNARLKGFVGRLIEDQMRSDVAGMSAAQSGFEF